MKLLLRNESLKVNQFQLHRLIGVHFALLYSQFPVLETLLASLSVGISTAMKNWLKIPLHLAVKIRSAEMVTILMVQPGLKLDGTYNFIRTLLMTTTGLRFYSPQEVQALLSDLRVVVNFANAQGDTALHHAASCANVGVARDLLWHAETKTDVENWRG
jgi:Ankyrin repeat